MTVDLHIGIPVDLIDQAIIFDRIPGWHVLFMGPNHDSWEDWGSPAEPGETGRHVIVRSESISEAINSLNVFIQEKFILVPLTHVYQEAIIASVTDSEDWAEEFFHIKAGPLWAKVSETDEGEEEE